MGKVLLEKLVIDRRVFLKLAGFELLNMCAPASLHSAESKEESRVSYTGDGSITDAEANDFIKQIEAAEKIVSSYLGMKYDRGYTVNVSQHHVTSRALIHVYQGNRGHMDFPTSGVKKGNSAVAHEVTHVIAPNYNRFLAEGLAVYIQDRFQKNKAPPTFGRDIHQGISEQSPIPLEDLLKETKDSFYYWSRRTARTPEQRSAYFHAGSFVKFLIEDKSFGEDEKSRLEKFKRVYSLADEGHGAKIFQEVYRLSLTDLENRWRSYLKNYGQRSELPLTIATLTR